MQDESGALFNQQAFRQLSTSPPPFTYATYPAEVLPYSSYAPMPYTSLPTCSDAPLYASYLPPMTSTYQPSVPSLAYAVKQDGLYAEEDINPFNMNFASMAGIDMAAAQSYTGSSPQVNRPRFGRP